MEVQEVRGKAPNEVVESLLARGINKFTPPQEAAIRAGLLDGRNVLVAAPTASGKTLVAELAAMNAVFGQRRKAVYIAPMRALVQEKYSEFREAYPYLRIGMSIGDLDAGDSGLRDYDVLFVSTEKFDSLMRHGIDWLGRVGCVIFDEVHMLGDNSRGPTLEILITRLMHTCDAQAVALSATIGNAGEIARWLGAELVESGYRPVKLKRGVVHNGVAYCASELGGEHDVVEEEIDGTSSLQEMRILQDTLGRSKQMLAFYSTKRNAEAGATRAAQYTEAASNKGEVQRLAEVADRVERALERPTEQCTKLASLVRRGAAFHHAGLLNAQRSLIEGAFREGLIKAICSTTTLGLGVNLPAHTVLVKDINRYDGGTNEMLGVNEVLQLFGRAGRPKYDTEGRAFVIAPYRERVADLYNTYIAAKPESVDSSLGLVPVLRTHVLAFIAEGFLTDKEQIIGFLKKTFYSFQYGSEKHLRGILGEILEDLVGFEFIEEHVDGRLTPTKVGKRVSELYIDPLSAKWMLNCLEPGLDTLGVLYVICSTLEMRPYVRSTRDAEERFAHYMHINKDGAILREMGRMEYGHYEPERAFSTALMLSDWMEEKREQDIVAWYRTTPGEIYSKLTNADWVIYSAIELERLVHNPVRELVDIRVRLRYGIKEELLDLVRLEQIGRVRARLLYMNGVRRVADIKDNKDKVERLLGKEVSRRVLAQVGLGDS